MAVINPLSKLTFTQYVAHLRANGELKSNLDAQFVDKFKEMVGQKGCVIPHTNLEELGLYTLADSAQVRRILYAYQENIDWTPCEVAGMGTRGCAAKTKYLLSTECFKMICMQSQNKTAGRDVRQYFIDLETAFWSYQKYEFEYELEKQRILLAEKDATIEQKECKIDQLIYKMDEERAATNQLLQGVTQKLDDLLFENAEARLDVQEMTAHIEDVRDELGAARDTLDHVAEKVGVAVHTRVRLLDDPRHEVFAVFRLNKPGHRYAYYVMRRQHRYLSTGISNLQALFPACEEWFRVEGNPNSVNIYHLVKAELKDHVKTHMNYLNVDPAIEDEFEAKVRAVYEERKNIGLITRRVNMPNPNERVTKAMMRAAPKKEAAGR